MKKSVYNSTPRQVREELDALPADERLVIMLVCVEGLSYQEAASKLFTSVEAIKTRLLRGRLTLMTKLAGKEQCLARSDIVRHRGDGRKQEIFDSPAPDGT